MPQVEEQDILRIFQSSFYHSHGNLTANYTEIRSKARLRPNKQKKYVYPK